MHLEYRIWDKASELYKSLDEKFGRNWTVRERMELTEEILLIVLSK